MQRYILFVLAIVGVWSDASACDNSWRPIGGVNPSANGVHALVEWQDGGQAKLVVGGSFSHIASIQCNGVAVWDGTNWSALGTGLGVSARVYALAVFNGQLIAAGDFDNGVLHDIARWNGTSWVPMSTWFTASRVNALAVYNGELYAGGEFMSTAVGGPSALMKYLPATDLWGFVGFTPSTTVNALTVHNGELVAGGSFILGVTGGPAALNLARFDGTTWRGFTGWQGGSQIYALHSSLGNLYVGGFAVSIAPPPNASGVVRWNGSAFSSLGTGTSGTVRAMTTYQGRLIVAGEMGTIQGTTGAGVGAWDGSTWDRIGGTIVNAANVLLPHQGDLIMGGTFTNAPWSTPAATYLGSLQCNFCPADLDDGADQGQHDNAVNIDDLIYFLTTFEAGSPNADLDNGSGLGVRDSAVTIDDLLFMLAHFEAGC